MRLRRALLVGVATVLAFAIAPTARATYDPIDSGTTAIRLDNGFLSLLRAHGVTIATREGAVFRSGSLRFSVSGGTFDPTTKKGTVEHGGTVLFEGSGRAVSLKQLQLKTTRRSSPFVAKLGGGQLKLGRAHRLVVARQGFADQVTTAEIRLSAKFATRLSKRLRLRGVFGEGMLIGTAVTRANPATIAILGKGRATFELDPGMVAKLDSLFVAVNPIFPAERPDPFTLPIFSGKLAPGLDAGFLQLHGALELLQLGGGQVIWSAPVLDLGTRVLSPEVEVKPSPPYAGKAGSLAVVSLSVPAGSSSADLAHRTLAVSGGILALTEATTAAFNEVFAKPQGKQGVFVAGEPFGRISFAAQAQ